MRSTTMSFFIFLILSGCASVGNKLDPAKVAQVKEGTTQQKVYELLGMPNSVTEDSASYRICEPMEKKKHLTILTYSYAHAQTFGKTVAEATIVYVNKKTGKVCKVTSTKSQY